MFSQDKKQSNQSNLLANKGKEETQSQSQHGTQDDNGKKTLLSKEDLTSKMVMLFFLTFCFIIVLKSKVNTMRRKKL